MDREMDRWTGYTALNEAPREGAHNNIVISECHTMSSGR